MENLFTPSLELAENHDIVLKNVSPEPPSRDLKKIGRNFARNCDSLLSNVSLFLLLLSFSCRENGEERAEQFWISDSDLCYMQTFTSDSEEEAVNHKPANLKKKQKSSGYKLILIDLNLTYGSCEQVMSDLQMILSRPETVLEKIPPAQCLENSMEFLKRRKMKVSRSNSVLINAKQALRLLSTPGNLLSKDRVLWKLQLLCRGAVDFQTLRCLSDNFGAKLLISILDCDSLLSNVSLFLLLLSFSCRENGEERAEQFWISDSDLCYMQTFTSDSEEEAVNHKPANLKKKQKSSGYKLILIDLNLTYGSCEQVMSDLQMILSRPETVLEKIPPAQCLENSMEFLKRRKMKVSRSNSVLINAKQALRLLSTPGNLLSKDMQNATYLEPDNFQNWADKCFPINTLLHILPPAPSQTIPSTYPYPPYYQPYYYPPPVEPQQVGGPSTVVGPRIIAGPLTTVGPSTPLETRAKDSGPSEDK
ncbi:hypothetical protein IEQ34_013649 [Dendrobium chrysotoxum]|uniref:Uncharacterized protein n=1 Tax=Dendrobium chrysotoxum TaxID=161865 RepID=A0AAV7GRG5_DENCH|nr:hypothetical protein IEQ34_013649 [Dendrobium chrysotoxum]